VSILSADIQSQLAQQGIELPSWAFGNSGTRFRVWTTEGTPRDPFEKIADAAEVNRVTGLAPSVALHIPWDKVDDFGALRRHAEELGVAAWAPSTRTPSRTRSTSSAALTHDRRVACAARPIDHHLACIDDHGCQTGSRDLKIWLAEGSNYPGQTDMRARQDRLNDSLRTIYERLTGEQRLVLEYKFFEPALYHDRRARLGHLLRAGQRRSASGPWCAWTPGTTRPARTSSSSSMQLLRLGKLGSFDFNSRFYADDDLIVGAADPVPALPHPRRGHPRRRPGTTLRPVAFMLDQCHNIEAKIPGQIRSVLNVQEMTARALLIDQPALRAAQSANDVLGAQAVFMDAFYTDVRPALAEWRESRGLPADPMAAYAASGYQQKIEAERVGGTQAGWGA
jgi:L-rhamnose isomerase/sugar isomerase